jgi:hypothetical protein
LKTLIAVLVRIHGGGKVIDEWHESSSNLI